MMDQKLAIRYQISPFGSGKPRFGNQNRTIDITQNPDNNLLSNESLSMKDKHAASDLMNEHYKRREKNRKTYTFASNVSRFKYSPRNLEESSLNKNDNGLLSDEISPDRNNKMLNLI